MFQQFLDFFQKKWWQIVCAHSEDFWGEQYSLRIPNHISAISCAEWLKASRHNYTPENWHGHPNSPVVEIGTVIFQALIFKGMIHLWRLTWNLKIIQFSFGNSFEPNLHDLWVQKCEFSRVGLSNSHSGAIPGRSFQWPAGGSDVPPGGSGVVSTWIHLTRLQSFGKGWGSGWGKPVPVNIYGMFGIHGMLLGGDEFFKKIR